MNSCTEICIWGAVREDFFKKFLENYDFACAEKSFSKNLPYLPPFFEDSSGEKGVPECLKEEGKKERPVTERFFARFL